MITETIEEKTDRFEQDMGCLLTRDEDIITITFAGETDALIAGAVYGMQFPCDFYDADPGIVSADMTLPEIALEWLLKSEHAGDILDLVFRNSMQGGSDIDVIQGIVRRRHWSECSQSAMFLLNRWVLEMEIVMDGGSEE